MLSDQILAYADRNNMCHTGITNMIDAVNFQGLAQRIKYIKELLVKCSERERSEMENYMTMIQEIQDEWFMSVFLVSSDSEIMTYVLTSKGNQKLITVAEKKQRGQEEEKKIKEEEKKEQERLEKEMAAKT